MEMAELRGTKVVDLYARMRDAVYFTDAIHATEAGMKLKADLLAPVINVIIVSLIKSK